MLGRVKVMQNRYVQQTVHTARPDIMCDLEEHY